MVMRVLSGGCATGMTPRGTGDGLRAPKAAAAQRQDMEAVRTQSVTMQPTRFNSTGRVTGAVPMAVVVMVTASSHRFWR